MKLTKTRKGYSSHGGDKGKLKKLLEGSTIVDLLTLGTLALNFQILRSASTGYGSSIFRISTDINIIAAQLSALVIGIYIIEAIIDSAGE